MNRDPTTGRIISGGLPIGPRFEAKIFKEPNSGCWLWTGSIGSHGYGQMSICNRPHTCHKVAYELYRGPVPDGLYVLHKCDTRSCCNPDHLYIGTQKENGRDMVERGRAFLVGRMGEQTNGHKLKSDQVREILSLKDSGQPARVIAAKYGVVHTTILAIWKRRAWQHISV